MVNSENKSTLDDLVPAGRPAPRACMSRPGVPPPPPDSRRVKASASPPPRPVALPVAPTRAAALPPPPIPPSRVASSPVAPEAPAAKVALEPIIPVDDADLPDNTPTRVLLSSERLALVPPKRVSASPPPASSVVLQGVLPPPPRPAGFRSSLPTQPASWRVPASSPPVSSSMQSVPPMALSAPPPAMAPPSRRVSRGLVAVGGVAAAAVLALGLLGAKGAIFASHTGGSLVATVAGAEGQPVKGLAVFVDGARRCESSPCRVDELAIGSHFVQVTAPGYVPTTAQAVAVHSGQDAVLRLDLSPLERTKSDDQAVTNDSGEQHQASPDDNATPDDQGVVQASSLPATPVRTASPVRVHHAVFHHAHVASAHRSAAPAEKPSSSSPAATGKGVIILSSTPATNLVVDGHPLGSTPKAVRVDAGVHTVVFAGEAGRVVRAINVKPGARLNVAVTF